MSFIMSSGSPSNPVSLPSSPFVTLMTCLALVGDPMSIVAPAAAEVCLSGDLDITEFFKPVKDIIDLILLLLFGLSAVSAASKEELSTEGKGLVDLALVDITDPSGQLVR